MVRDSAWATTTLSFGFSVQGVWPEGDACDIQTVDRSRSEKIVAKGNDRGEVRRALCQPWLWLVILPPPPRTPLATIVCSQSDSR